MSQSDFSALTSSFVTNSVSLISELSVVGYIRRISWSVYSELAPSGVDNGDKDGGTYTTNTAPTKSLLIARCSRLASCSARGSIAENKSSRLDYPQFFLWHCASVQIPMSSLEGMTVGENTHSQTLPPEDYFVPLPRLGWRIGESSGREEGTICSQTGCMFLHGMLTVSPNRLATRCRNGISSLVARCLNTAESLDGGRSRTEGVSRNGRGKT